MDTRKYHGEIRYQAIGKTPKNELIFTVFTYRITITCPEVIHLISARNADEKETKQYYNYTFSDGEKDED